MERFLDYFVPDHYDLDFQIDKYNATVRAIVKLRGEAKSNSVKLHANDNLRIERIFIWQDYRDLPENISPSSFSHDEKCLLLSNVKPGKYTIQIEFSFELTENMQGAYLSKYRYNDETQLVVATQFESHYARECFPCVDEPAAKATFKLSISVPDATDTVLSNMPIQQEITLSDAEDFSEHPMLKKVEFQETPKMSTYLLAFAIGQFQKLTTTSRDGIVVNTYAGLHQPLTSLQFAADFAVKSLDFYNDLFKVSFPLPKLDQLALPDFEAGAMENWGLMTFREQALLAEPNSSLDQRLYVATVVAHEISHMWFGDLVTMEWWDDLWLNESFACLMETYAVDRIAPELNAWDDFYTGTVVPALRRDCLPGVQPVKVAVQNVEDIANLFDGAIVYAKGARLMLMLLRAMGGLNFFQGITEYFSRHQYGNATADDLWAALNPFATFDVKEFMTPWLTQPGYPVLTGGVQQRFLLTGDDSNYQYPILEVKNDLSGHYLINLSGPEFDAALKDFSNLHYEQKLRLLFDRELLAKTPLVSSATLLPLLEKFTSETSYVIWDALSMIIADLKIFIDPDSPESDQFKQFCANLAQEQYNRLGITAKSGERDNDIKLRPIIMSLMSYSNRQDFIQNLLSQYQNQDPAQIDSNLRSVILGALVKQNNTLCQKYLNLYFSSTDPEFKLDLMVAITSTRDPLTAQNYFTLLQDGSIKPQDRLHFFIRLVRNHITRDQALDWMYQNWNWLATAEGDKTIPDYPRLVANIIRSADDARRFQDFFKDKQDEPILSRDLKIAFAEIDARLQLISSDAPAVVHEISKRTKKV